MTSPQNIVTQFVEKRAALGCDLKQYSSVAWDVERIIAIKKETLSPLWKFRWNSALAEAAMQSGYRETALHRFQKLLENLDSSIPPLEIAYICGKISHLLPDGDPDGDRFSERARDLYLMGGARISAVHFQINRAIRLEQQNPPLALSLLREASTWVTNDDLYSREAKARISNFTAGGSSNSLTAR